MDDLVRRHLVKRLREEYDSDWDVADELCQEAADCIEAQDKRNKELEAALRDTLAAWDFWQSQETRSGFSELFANICEARAALGEEKDG